MNMNESVTASLLHSANLHRLFLFSVRKIFRVSYIETHTLKLYLCRKGELPLSKLSTQITLIYSCFPGILWVLWYSSSSRRLCVMLLATLVPYIHVTSTNQRLQEIDSGMVLADVVWLSMGQHSIKYRWQISTSYL